MALNQLPVVEATINVIHSDPSPAGSSFTTTLDASDGAPIAPQDEYTFDLDVFAPDIVGTYPNVEVYRDATGEKVEADIEVESALVRITFHEDVEPTDYRVKVIG